MPPPHFLSTEFFNEMKTEKSSLVQRKSERQKSTVIPAPARRVRRSRNLCSGTCVFKHLSCRFLFNLIRRSLEFFASAKNRDDVWCFCKSHLMREITTSHSASAPRNDVMDSVVIASHIKIGKIIMSFPARCCAFVRSGIFAPARVLKKHSSCRFLNFIRIIRRSLEFFVVA